MKTIRQLKYQEVYAQEKVTKVDSLSLVLSGKWVYRVNYRPWWNFFLRQATTFYENDVFIENCRNS